MMSFLGETFKHRGVSAHALQGLEVLNWFHLLVWEESKGMVPLSSTRALRGRENCPLTCFDSEAFRSKQEASGKSSEAIKRNVFARLVTPKVMQLGHLGLGNQPQPKSEVH